MPVVIPSRYDDRWAPDLEELGRRLSKKTKAVVLCTPSNPTGMGIEPDQLKRLLDIIERESSAYVISDEIYERLVYDDYVHTSPLHVRPDLKDRIVVASGVAKSYAMTGWRLGFVGGPKDLVAGMLKLQQQRYSCATSVSQVAAAFALHENADVSAAVDNMLKHYSLRRTLVAEHIENISGLRAHSPQGAFYFFIDASELFPMSHSRIGKITDDLSLIHI